MSRTQLVSLRLTQPHASVRSLIVGLVCVLAVVGAVVTAVSLPRWQWMAQCSRAGGHVVSHVYGADPYLAYGSTISYTCEGPDGVISSWSR